MLLLDREATSVNEQGHAAKGVLRGSRWRLCSYMALQSGSRQHYQVLNPGDAWGGVWMNIVKANSIV